jgi:RimJ/RimL family protein N-acetyltransferase
MYLTRRASGAVDPGPRAARARGLGPLILRSFSPEDAEVIVGWVANGRELFWLAPSTDMPLTAGKVIAWTRDRGMPVVLCAGDEGRPVGYAELNPLRRSPTHLWIGHVIVDPAWRGRGVGQRLIQLLVDHAFRSLGARRVSLMVFPHNWAAVRCYLKAGFHVFEEQYHEFGRPPRSYRMLHLLCAAPPPSGGQVSRWRAQFMPQSKKR